MFGVMFLFQPTYLRGRCAPVMRIYESAGTSPKRPSEGCQEFAAIDPHGRMQPDISIRLTEEPPFLVYCFISADFFVSQGMKVRGHRKRVFFFAPGYNRHHISLYPHLL